MKDIDLLKDEVDGLLELRKRPIPITETKSEAKQRRSELKSASKRIKFLNSCIMYLETNPTEEFIQKEIERIKNQIDVVDGRFTIEFTQPFGSLKDEKDARTNHNKKYGLNNLKLQLKTLRFIYK